MFDTLWLPTGEFCPEWILQNLTENNWYSLKLGGGAIEDKSEAEYTRSCNSLYVVL